MAFDEAIVPSDTGTKTFTTSSSASTTDLPTESKTTGCCLMHIQRNILGVILLVLFVQVVLRTVGDTGQSHLCRRWAVKFFVPGQSAEHAEDIYNDFQALHKAADKRIRSITFLDRELQREVQLCVGQDEPWYGGKILLILLCYPRGYQIFTQERGIDSGSPIMVQTTDARVEEFDPFDRPSKLGRGA
jgi:hypothetical protein